jgi:lysophospholipase L1-like esterase
LLIGVNNQYSGRSVEEYKLEFEKLLRRVINLTKDKPERVVVISIPDYSITPFAASLDRKKITSEIDLYNSVNKAVSIQYKVQYLDIAASYRENGHNSGYLSEDRLHPSAREYTNWSEKLTEIISRELK